MASNAPISSPVSTPINALIEQLGRAMAGQQPMPSPAAIYGQLIRIRDEAELLEVRASARDAKVAELLAELKAAAADRLDRLETNPPFWCGVDVANGPSIAVLWARRSGKTFAIEAEQRRAGVIDSQMQAAAVENRWATICQEYLKRCDAARDAASQGDQP